MCHKCDVALAKMYYFEMQLLYIRNDNASFCVKNDADIHSVMLMNFLINVAFKSRFKKAKELGTVLFVSYNVKKVNVKVYISRIKHTNSSDTTKH